MLHNFKAPMKYFMQLNSFSNLSKLARIIGK